MKEGWRIKLKSLIHVEWRKGIPRLIIHEKYETVVKWTLRVITALGIALSFLSMDTSTSVLVSLGLLLIEQFIERAIFEYTTIVIQNFPQFNLDGQRWKTMGFALPDSKNDEFPPYMGPAFDDREYAEKLFHYIKSWNKIDDNDPDNLIILSIVMEPNSTYSFFIYANPKRKNLDPIFKDLEEKRKFEKFGKRHQQLVMQMILAHNFEYKPGLYIHTFLSTYSPSDTFFFTPFVVDGNNLHILNSLSIRKSHFQLKRREKLTKKDIEYYYKMDTDKKDMHF